MKVLDTGDMAPHQSGPTPPPMIVRPVLTLEA